MTQKKDLTPAELKALKQQHKNLVIEIEKLEYEQHFAKKK